MSSNANPWLAIPLADYEAHMALPHVAQAELLARTLATTARELAAASLLVLGCAGGNGFDRLPPSLQRVVGVDLNPRYVERARERYAARVPGLELHAADAERDVVNIAPVDVVFAALFFEHVDAARVLPKVRDWLRPGGALVTMLQLPSDVRDVTPSPYTSLAQLAPVMHLVEPQQLADLAATHGFRLLRSNVATAGGGKQFAVQTFIRES